MWLIEVKKEKAYWDEETTRESCEFVQRKFTQGLGHILILESKVEICD